MKIFVKSLILLFILSLIFISCSSVRSKKSSKGQGKAVTEKTEAKADTTKTTESQKAVYRTRFSDTTVVNVAQSKYKVQPEIIRQFNEAAELFDKGQYEKACPKIEVFADTFIYGDSLYFEARFLRSECLIIEQNYKTARQILESMLEDEKLPEIVLQKVLVRLGQIFCVENEPKKAEEMFSRLKKEFPGSIYIQVANCDAVKQ